MIRRLAEAQGHDARLYVSLHSPFSGERAQIIPSANGYSVPELMDESLYYANIKNERVTLSYLLLEGINDSDRHADEIIKTASPELTSIQILLYNKVE